jgi:hypothetical protein
MLKIGLGLVFSKALHPDVAKLSTYPIADESSEELLR